MTTRSGRTVVITGSTRGLGLATARAFGQRGHRVVISARSADAVERVVRALAAEGIEAAGRVCDVGRLADVEALAAFATARFGSFDVWINNAARSAAYGSTLAVEPHDFASATQTNVFGTYHGTLVALRAFVPRRAGVVVNLLGRGDRKPVPMQSAYAASKAWIRSFTRAVARETKGSGVSVLLFHPGLMRTELLLRPAVAPGETLRASTLETLLRLWGQDPEAPALALVRFVLAAGGRTGLERHATGPLWTVLGPLRALVARRPKPHVVLERAAAPGHGAEVPRPPTA